jgi:hypothetical protein
MQYLTAFANTYRDFIVYGTCSDQLRVCTRDTVVLLRRFARAVMRRMFTEVPNVVLIQWNNYMCLVPLKTNKCLVLWHS